MVSLNLADTFVTFLALLGPQKVLLSFARISRTLDARAMRLVVMTTSVIAAIVGALCALTAPWLASFFHIGPASLALASGLVFFIYAVGLVLGIHFDPTEAHAAAIADGNGNEDEAGTDPLHPVRSGVRVMLLPFVVSPLAVAADLEVSLAASGWGARWVVAGAFALVALVDAFCALIFTNILRRTHEIILEVLSRLLGVLLAAVGVQLFLEGLNTLGVLHSTH
ncbi:MAG TPA: MarC family protein [Trebonia sp.]